MTKKVAVIGAGITGLCALPEVVAEDRTRAEQFATIVDDAITVDVTNQQTVTTRHPAGALDFTVIVDVEGDTILDVDGLDAIAVEVEDDWGLEAPSRSLVGLNWR